MANIAGGISKSFGEIDDSRWVHARSEVEPGPIGVEKGLMIHYITCPPPEGVKSKGTVLLVHGWPQTSYQFRRVITPLADDGWFVVAPDYRGAGGSTKPRNGFDKATMARDLHTLITAVLGIKAPIHLVGHDIGAMIVHAYATQFPTSTASITTGEAGLPGSQAFYARKATMGAWHYSFHSVLDLPELLVQGKEREYLKHMYDRLSQNPDAISNEDLGVYAQSYAQPGAMRCGFDCYRAFDEDAAANEARVEEKGKCGVRCLALWGETSYVDEKGAKEMCGRYYEQVEFGQVKGSGHWIAEENPRGFVEAVLAWIGKQ